MTTPDRRVHSRFDLDRPVKVQCLTTGKYLAGTTSNVSVGGAKLVIKHPSLMVPGQRIKLGVAWQHGQAVISSESMTTATVVRSLGHGANQHVALQFDEPQSVSMTG